MEHINYVYLSERQEHDPDKEGNPIKHSYLNLGDVTDFSLTRLIVSSVRSVALTTRHPELVEYALELTKALNEWAKKLPPEPTAGEQSLLPTGAYR